MGMAPNKGKGEAHRWICEHVTHAGDDCLIWPFKSNQTGYAYFQHLGLRYRAHRYMCQLAHGEPPSPNHQAAHSCGNGRRGCMNPRHLSWKTNGENQLDRREHGTAQRGAKLTVEQVTIIRSLKGVVPQTSLAKLCGVTHSTIQYAINTENKVFKHRSPRSSQ